MPGLHVTVRGPVDAPRIVLLHGFLGDGTDWLPLVERLATRFRVECVDLPGHGQSLGLAADVYTWVGALNELAALTHSARGLVGYSMGGRLALTLAMTAGGPSLQALIVISAAPGLEEAAARDQRRREDEARAVALERDGLPAFVESWYRQPLFSSLHRQPELLQRLRAKRQRGSALELAKALRGLSVSQQRPLWNELPGLAVPALFVAGEDDPVYVVHARRAADLSPLGRSLMVPHSGHLPHLERPEVCGAAIAEFLEQYLE